MKIAAAPTPSSTRTKSGAVMFLSSQPRRILAVIGNFTALTIVFTRCAVLSNSVIIAEPPPVLQTLRTGQPMLMSIESTPIDSRYCAASRISSGTAPNNCTANGLSASFVSMSLSALELRSSSDRALTRSVVARHRPPTSRSTSRNGRFVYPASGERNRLDFSWSDPNCISPSAAHIVRHPEKTPRQKNALGQAPSSAPISAISPSGVGRSI